MAWAGDFRSQLDSPSQVYNYTLRFLGSCNDYFLGSAGTISQSGRLRIADEGPTIQGSSVIPQRWAVTFGGFSVPLVGDIRQISAGMLRKGAVAELLASLNGGAPERIAIGQLRGLQGQRGRWTAQFTDLLGMLASRLSTKQGELNFFYNAGNTTTINTAHTASDTNLLVNDVTIFDKDSNEDGLVKIIDSANSREDYWRWSSKVITSGTAGYLVITGHGAWPQQLSGGYNSVPINQKAMSVARIFGRPDYEFLRMMMSTGNATQGSFDDFPKSWGAGYCFDPNLIDLTDVNQQHGIWNTSSGSYEIQLVFESPATSGIRAILDQFAQIGMWPAARQGKITWRACQDPDSANSTALSISDNDIFSIAQHEIYSSQASACYGKSEITTGAQKASASDPDTINTQSVTINNIRSMPANNKITRANRFIYRLDTPAQSVKATADMARMKRWDFNVWERLTLIVAPRFSVLCAGDIVSITSRFLIGYSEARGKTYSRRRGMVLGVSWEPGRARCTLSIGILPS